MENLGKVAEILDIKLNDGLLKILFLTDTNKIFLFEGIIDTNSLLLEWHKESLDKMSDFSFGVLENAKVELKLIKDKDNSFFTIIDITNQILDKFMKESEDN